MLSVLPLVQDGKVPNQIPSSPERWPRLGLNKPLTTIGRTQSEAVQIFLFDESHTLSRFNSANLLDGQFIGFFSSEPNNPVCCDNSHSTMLTQYREHREFVRFHKTHRAKKGSLG